ncbi:MAG: nuclear transport factor 2 family protein [Proteobacteria bacterium]|nr:nuclear transport factor 2 family protein [Pseudomonadota bacterium]
MFAAFNRHDAAGVVATMTDDVVFDAAAGAEVHGTRHIGRAAVEAAFAKLFRDQPDVRWDEVRHYPGDGFAVTTWTLRATRPDGARIEVEGIDLFTLRDGLVSRKRAFRKERPPLQP